MYTWTIGSPKGGVGAYTEMGAYSRECGNIAYLRKWSVVQRSAVNQLSLWLNPTSLLSSYEPRKHLAKQSDSCVRRSADCTTVLTWTLFSTTLTFSVWLRRRFSEHYLWASFNARFTYYKWGLNHVQETQGSDSHYTAVDTLIVCPQCTKDAGELNSAEHKGEELRWAQWCWELSICHQRCYYIRKWMLMSIQCWLYN